MTIVVAVRALYFEARAAVSVGMRILLVTVGLRGSVWFFRPVAHCMPPAHQKADQFVLRDALLRDEPQMRVLLPELASFDLPAHRQPGQLWESDAELLAEHLRGGAQQCFARIAVDVGKRQSASVAGLTLVSMREELLSHEPSAHLEAIVVAEWARGAGLGARLMGDAEARAKSRGAKSMTLHVFGRNARARGLYAGVGYDEELIRCIKWLTD